MSRKNAMRISMLSTFLCVLFGISTVLCGKNTSLTFEFRIAACPNEDRIIVERAIASMSSNIYENSSLIAKWVPVAEESASEFTASPNFVFRENAKGQLEVLVLVGNFDCTASDVSSLAIIRDRYGKPALEVIFVDSEPSLISLLTMRNQHRHLAQIINGELYRAPEIVARLYDHTVIPGLSEEFIKNLLKNSPYPVMIPNDALPPKRPLHHTFYFLLFSGIVLSLVVVLVLARFSKRNAHAPLRKCSGSKDYRATPKKKLKRYNMKQKLVFLLGVVIVAVLLLFPPWIGSRTEIITAERPEGYAGEEYEFLGFHFILSGEELAWQTLHIVTKVHYPLLAMLCGCTLAITVLLTILTRSRR